MYNKIIHKMAQLNNIQLYIKHSVLGLISYKKMLKNNHDTSNICLFFVKNSAVSPGYLRPPGKSWTELLSNNVT